MVVEFHDRQGAEPSSLPLPDQVRRNRTVPLASGSRFGRYELLAPLGAGGMGEVFRARDRDLARDVAVKVLPARFASDADRLARFSQEARAAPPITGPTSSAWGPCSTRWPPARGRSGATA